MAQIIAAPIAAALGGGVIATAIAQVGVGLAISAIANRLLYSNSAAENSGLRTQTTTSGEATGQTFMLGHYATAGNFVAPRLAHTGDSGTPNAYRTLVIDISDVAGAEWTTNLFVNEERVRFDGTTNATYGVTATAGSEYEDKIWVKYYDGTQTVADPYLIAEYGAHAERPWTANMIGEGICYAIVTIKYDADLWGGREPALLFEMKGIPLYDPSQDSTVGGVGSHLWADPTTWVSGNSNPVVMIYNIMRGIDLGNGRRFGGTAEEEDLPAAEWIAAINACNVMISSSNLAEIDQFTYTDIVSSTIPSADPIVEFAAGNVPTYSAGYEVRMGASNTGGDEPADVIEELLRACGGEVADLGGEVRIRVGDYPAASSFITDEDIYVTQAQDMQPFTALEESYNAVAGTYPSRQEAFQPKEAVPYIDSVAETEDGRYLPASLQLNALIWERQAQHVLRQWGLNARRMVRHTFSMPPRGLLINPLDVIDWTSDEYGYSGKDFDVAEIGIDPSTLSVTFSCREIDPTDTAWTPAFEATSFAPSSRVVYLDEQLIPGWAVSEVSILDDSGTARRVGILPSWDTDIPDALGVEIEIYLTSSGAIVYQGSTQNIERGDKLITSGILPGTSYDVRGRLVANRATGWTSLTTVTTDNVGITLEDLSVSLGKNLLSNATFATGTRNWAFEGSDPAFSETTLVLREPGTTWAGRTFPTLAIRQDGDQSSGVVLAYSESITEDGSSSTLDVPCVPGDNLIASSYISSFNCDGLLAIQFRDVSGAFISLSTPTNINLDDRSDSENPDLWTKYVNVAVAPANAAFCNITFYKNPTSLGIGSWLFIHKPQLEKASANATQPSEWDSGVTRWIDTPQIVDQAISITTYSFSDTAIPITADTDAAAHTIATQSVETVSGLLTETELSMDILSDFFSAHGSGTSDIPAFLKVMLDVGGVEQASFLLTPARNDGSNADVITDHSYTHSYLNTVDGFVTFTWKVREGTGVSGVNHTIESNSMKTRQLKK